MTAAASAAADLDRAAAAIAAARRTLLTGLVAADAGAVLAACDLAEANCSAVDPGSPESSRPIGPLVARIGSVTAAPEELRDRADLVLLWLCDPERVCPGFLDRFVAPAVDGARRRTIAVGPRDVAVAGTDHRHVVIAIDTAIDLARLVEALIQGVALDEAAGGPTSLAAARELATALAAAHGVAVVTDWANDAVGLAAWSTASLVRTLAHAKPAFEIPLGERDDAAIAVCTWRYGGAGAIDRADREGGRFLAAEADAVRLIDRREVDCVIVVGDATVPVTAALERAGDEIAIVRLPADEHALRRLVDRVGTARGSVA
jgi:formylmethanofuran dehydrogenase subunit B